MAARSMSSRRWTAAHAGRPGPYAQDVQDLAVADALRGIEGSPTLSRQVVEGDAATVLLAMARTADYLVVGAGRGDLRREHPARIRDRAMRSSRRMPGPGRSATDPAQPRGRKTP